MRLRTWMVTPTQKHALPCVRRHTCHSLLPLTLCETSLTHPCKICHFAVHTRSSRPVHRGEFFVACWVHEVVVGLAGADESGVHRVHLLRVPQYMCQSTYGCCAVVTKPAGPNEPSPRYVWQVLLTCILQVSTCVCVCKYNRCIHACTGIQTETYHQISFARRGTFCQRHELATRIAFMQCEGVASASLAAVAPRLLAVAARLPSRTRCLLGVFFGAAHTVVLVIFLFAKIRVAVGLFVHMLVKMRREFACVTPCAAHVCMDKTKGNVRRRDKKKRLLVCMYSRDCT
jgi:hypothetical protein